MESMRKELKDLNMKIEDHAMEERKEMRKLENRLNKKIIKTEKKNKKKHAMMYPYSLIRKTYIYIYIYNTLNNTAV